MNKQQALWTVLSLSAVVLAGCTDSGSDGLTISVSPGADPLTDAFTFKASGASADTYTWDFGDGTTAEGAQVEHVFGFSNGAVTVKLTACTGAECTSVSQSVDLGGGNNTNPAGVFQASTDWATVGETVRLSVAASTDAESDPILVRWFCERVADLLPPADGGGHVHAAPGVPFGVNALAIQAPALTGGDDHGAQLCADHDITVDQPWSAGATTIQGNFAQEGIYRIDVQVKDPKSVGPWIGRLDLFVSATRPAAEQIINFSGDLQGGSSGQVQDGCQQILDGDCPLVFDYEEKTFSLPIPNKLATVKFTSTTDTSGSVEYEIKSSTGSITVPRNGDAEKLLGAMTFYNGRSYTVAFTVGESGVSLHYDFTMVVENDLNPLHLYQAAP